MNRAGKWIWSWVAFVGSVAVFVAAVVSTQLTSSEVVPFALLASSGAISLVGIAIALVSIKTSPLKSTIGLLLNASYLAFLIWSFTTTRVIV